MFACYHPLLTGAVCGLLVGTGAFLWIDRFHESCVAMALGCAALILCHRFLYNTFKNSLKVSRQDSLTADTYIQQSHYAYDPLWAAGVTFFLFGAIGHGMMAAYDHQHPMEYELPSSAIGTVYGHHYRPKYQYLDVHLNSGQGVYVRFSSRHGMTPYIGKNVLIKGNLRCVTRRIHGKRYRYGDLWRYRGTIWEVWMKKPPEIIGNAQPSWRLWLAHHRHRMVRTLLDRMTPPYGGMAAALMTGDKHSLDPSVRTLFAKASISHVLAISGLHFFLVGLLIWEVFARFAALLGCFRWGIWVAVFLSFTLFVGYALITGGALSVWRACFMTMMYITSVAIGRLHSGLYGLFLSAALCLLFQPYSALDMGFQLSYISVLGLMTGWIPPWGPWWKRWIITPMIASLWASFYTMPLVLYHFGWMNPINIWINIWVVPWMSLAVMPMILLSALTMFSSTLTSILLPIVEYILQILLVGVRLSTTSWGTLWTPCIPPWLPIIPLAGSISYTVFKPHGLAAIALVISYLLFFFLL